MKKGRPTKLTANFVKVAEEVLSEGINAIIFTDEQLIDEINDRLPEVERITHRTFQAWKAGDFSEKESEGLAFSSSYKKALRIQQQNLFAKLEKGSSGEWQKYAWIIERKFNEWNLKKLNEVSGPSGKTLKIRFADD